MSAGETRRGRLRALLRGEACIRPASVFDPLSARVAEELGFPLVFLAGSDAALAVLGAPDITLLTMTEFTQQARRIARAVDVPLLVDGDHGYGNALNARRMVQELEAAGVAGTTVEDTDLPAPYGGKARLVSVHEATDRVRAAVDARTDPDFIVAGRTNAALCRDAADLAERLDGLASTGCDAVFVAGLRTPEDLRAAAARLAVPLIIPNPVPALSDQAFLASCNVRVCLAGQRPSHAAAVAVQARLAAQSGAGIPEETSDQLIARLTRRAGWAAASKAYLGH